MGAAPLPPDELERLATLAALHVLDTGAEERFDRLTRLACRLFDVPIALVSLVAADRQWFKSRQGVDRCEAPRDVAFCAYTILGDEALVVDDAALDARFADNPAVVGEPHVRFYAGQPVRAADGHKVGTLCVMDRRPRQLGQADLTALRDLAAAVEDELNAVQLGQALDTLVADEIARRQAERRTTLQYAAAQVLAESATLAEATPRLLQSIGEAIDWDVAGLWAVEADDGPRLRHVGYWRRPGCLAQHFLASTHGRRLGRDEGLPGKVWADGQPFWVADIARHPGGRAEAALADGLRAAFVVPIASEGTCLGVLEFLRQDPAEPDQGLLLTLGGIGSQIAQFIRRREAEAALQAANEARARELVRSNQTLLAEVGERMRTELSLARERDFIAAVVDTAGSLVVVLDPDGSIVRFNRACERITGWRFDEVAGRPFWEIFHTPEQAAEARQRFATLRPADFPSTGDAIWRTRAGETRIIDWTNAAILDADGAVEHVIGTGIDITARREAEAALARELVAVERATTETRAILDATSEAMALIGADGRFLTVNRRFVELFELPAEALIGQSLAERQDALPRFFGGQANVNELIIGSLRDHEQRFTRILTQTSPVERALELYSTPVRVDSGEYLGRLFALRDVTREREVDRMKTEFVSLVSHELRTPLTSIKGYVDLLLEDEVGELFPDQREFLEIVRDNADRLVALINDLLDVSRIEAGRIELRREPLDMAALIGGVAASLRPQMEAKGQQLTVAVPADLPFVDGDHDRVLQILVNLLSNAHKYTPSGGAITVRAEAAAGGQLVQVAVIDTGIGLSTEEQGQLFQKFFRAPNRTAQEAGGTGLGLSITRSLVQMHGGEISVESAPGRGSTFSFTLPGTPRRAAPDPAEPALVPTSGIILVVDDEPDIAHLIRRYLERAGYQVLVAQSAEEAVRVAREALPDLITLDLNLPDADGMTALTRLKDDPATGAIPVVILSVLPDDGRGRELGAVDYLAKPVEERAILRRVNAILQHSRSRTILVADDEPDVRRLLAAILHHEGYRVVEAADGVEAVALAHHAHPDLVLLDVKMPRLDGIGVVKQLRGDSATRALPVVMMTASPGAFESSRDAVETLGVTSLLAKPLTPEELATALARGLDSRRPT